MSEKSMSKKRQVTKIKRKVPIQKRAGVTHESIIQATAQFLKKNPIDKLSTNKIAELAGVSIGTLYQYFSTKEAILQVLIRRQFEQDLKTIKESIGEVEPKTFEEGIQNIIEAVTELFLDQPQLRIVIYEQSRKLNLLQDKETFQHQVRTLLIQNFKMLSKGQYQQPNDLEMYVLTSAITGTLFFTATEYPEHLTRKAYRRELVKLIIGYYSL
jgi:AcrR family transcriptional regulator